MASTWALIAAAMQNETLAAIIIVMKTIASVPLLALLWRMFRELPAALSDWGKLVKQMAKITTPPSSSSDTKNSPTLTRDAFRKHTSLESLPVVGGVVAIAFLSVCSGPLEIWHIVLASMGVVLIVVGVLVFLLRILLAAILMVYESGTGFLRTHLESRPAASGSSDQQLETDDLVG